MSPNIEVGRINRLKVLRLITPGAFLDDGDAGILLPKRYLPKDVQVGDELDVFVYHDSEDRLIATTDKPKVMLDEFAYLQAVSVTHQGAFMDWGLMKDLFVPKSRQLSGMRTGAYYLVRVYLDERTGRLAATEKIESFLSNDQLTVKELDPVDMIIYRRTDIGYVVIINNKHTGVLHFSDIFREINVGDKLTGYVRQIYPNNSIDVALGQAGYVRVSDEAEYVLQLLRDNNGYLPYNDKSDPEAIYRYFSMSKKTFKMATGKLYKNRIIEFTKTGIKLLEKEA